MESATVTGVLFINCEKKTCSRIMDVTREMSGVKHAFRVSKSFREQGADVVVRLEGSSIDDIIQKKEEIGQITGVKEIRHKIGRP